MAPAILEEELPAVGYARSEGGFADVESPAATDDGNEGDNGNREQFENSKRRHLSLGSFRQIFDKYIMESNLGVLRSVEFGAAKLLFD